MTLENRLETATGLYRLLHILQSHDVIPSQSCPHGFSFALSVVARKMVTLSLKGTIRRNSGTAQRCCVRLSHSERGAGQALLESLLDKLAACTPLKSNPCWLDNFFCC